MKRIALGLGLALTVGLAGGLKTSKSSLNQAFNIGMDNYLAASFLSDIAPKEVASLTRCAKINRDVKFKTIDELQYTCTAVTEILKITGESLDEMQTSNDRRSLLEMSIVAGIGIIVAKAQSKY